MLCREGGPGRGERLWEKEARGGRSSQDVRVAFVSLLSYSGSSFELEAAQAALRDSHGPQKQPCREARKCRETESEKTREQSLNKDEHFEPSCGSRRGSAAARELLLLKQAGHRVFHWPLLPTVRLGRALQLLLQYVASNAIFVECTEGELEESIRVLQPECVSRVCLCVCVCLFRPYGPYGG